MRHSLPVALTFAFLLAGCAPQPANVNSTPSATPSDAPSSTPATGNTGATATACDGGTPAAATLPDGYYPIGGAKLLVDGQPVTFHPQITKELYAFNAGSIGGTAPDEYRMIGGMDWWTQNGKTAESPDLRSEDFTGSVGQLFKTTPLNRDAGYRWEGTPEYQTVTYKDGLVTFAFKGTMKRFVGPETQPETIQVDGVLCGMPLTRP